MPLPDNEQVNIELVIAVEDYPVLYNPNLKGYSNRSEQDKVWRLLAEQFQATDVECKQRWRNIRNALTRCIRSMNTTGSTSKKPYYLWDHLQYLLPFIKCKPQCGNFEFSPKPQPMTAESESEVEDADDGPDDQHYEEDQPATSSAALPKTSTPTSSLSSWRSSKINVKRVDPLEQVITQYFEKKGTQQQDPIAEADLSFLTSLLPEVTSLPPKKKRLFKRKVFELLDELTEDEPSPCTSK